VPVCRGTSAFNGGKFSVGFFLADSFDPGFGSKGSCGVPADEEAVVAKDEEATVALEGSDRLVRRHDLCSMLGWLVGWLVDEDGLRSGTAIFIPSRLAHKLHAYALL
jgi:hypothetical protein